MHLTAATALAADKIEVRIFAPTGSPEPRIRCTARIFNDEKGTDLVRLLCENMTPRTIYTLFLGQSATPGAIPVSFVGQLRADRQGIGRLVAELEIVNAFIGMDSGTGVVDVRGAGALGNGGLTVSLDYFRIYQGMPAVGGAPTVFGIAADQPGGVLVATSDRIPDPVQ
jgi:hypothetical protein